MFGLLNIGMIKEGVIRNFKKVLEMVGLSSKIDNNLYDLGFLERKLIIIVFVFVMNIDVVIFDELIIV